MPSGINWFKIEKYFAGHQFLFWFIGSVVVTLVVVVLTLCVTLATNLWPNQTRNFFERLWERLPKSRPLGWLRQWGLTSAAKQEALLLRLQGSTHQLIVWLVTRIFVFIYAATLGFVLIAMLTTWAVGSSASPPIARFVFVLFSLYLLPTPFFLFVGDTTMTLVKLNKRMRALGSRPESLASV